MAKEEIKNGEIDFSQDAGAGLANVTIADMAKPFLVILQALSPQVKKQNPKYIKGAEEGDIFNTVTLEVMKGSDGVFFIPTGFEAMIVEWRPRTEGGGLVGFHKDRSTVGETTKNEKMQDVNKAGNIIQPTNYHFGKYLDGDGEPQFAIIAMASTQLKKSRNWNSLMMSIRLKTKAGVSFTPASYSHQYHLTTELETKNDNSWFGWKIENTGILKESNLVLECRDHARQVASGQLKLTNTPVDAHDAEPLPSTY